MQTRATRSRPATHEIIIPRRLMRHPMYMDTMLSTSIHWSPLPGGEAGVASFSGSDSGAAAATAGLDIHVGAGTRTADEGNKSSVPGAAAVPVGVKGPLRSSTRLFLPDGSGTMSSPAAPPPPREPSASAGMANADAAPLVLEPGPSAHGRAKGSLRGAREPSHSGRHSCSFTFFIYWCTAAQTCSEL